MTRKRQATPVRRALRTDSALQSRVEDGIAALKKAHRDYLHQDIRAAFADSLDVDEGLRKGREQENRWDYLLGHEESRDVVALEPHSAKQDEISTVIRKRKSALAQLRAHLRDDARVAKWLWVASGKGQFANTEKAKLLLDQNGIEFVGTQVLAKHLPER
jgi:hypothetical protein